MSLVFGYTPLPLPSEDALVGFGDDLNPDTVVEGVCNAAPHQILASYMFWRDVEPLVISVNCGHEFGYMCEHCVHVSVIATSLDAILTARNISHLPLYPVDVSVDSDTSDEAYESSDE